MLFSLVGIYSYVCVTKPRQQSFYLLPEELKDVGILDVGQQALQHEVCVEAEGSDVVDNVHGGFDELPPVGT